MNKKMVSVMTAAAMVMAMPLSVSAGPVDTATGSQDIETEGSVKYVDTNVYSVTLPTDGCFNFTVDPQGILSALAPDTYTEELYPYGTAGYIVPAEGKGAYINNKSSVPIKLNVEAYVGKDSAGAASSVNLLDSDQYGLINSGIDNNMWLTFDITTDLEDPKTFVDETTITTANVSPNVLAITQNGVPTAPAKGTQISFALDKAAYKFGGDVDTPTYEMVTGEVGDSVGLRLSGMINTNADWSAYSGASAEKIVVKTVFDFEKLSTDYEASALDGRAHGVLADADPQYYAGLEYDDDGLPTGNTVTGVLEYAVGQGGIEIPFDFGAGSKEVSVTGISVGGTDIPATDYKVYNNVISIKITNADVDTALQTGTPEGKEVAVVITTSDSQTTTVNMIVYK